MFNSYLIKHDKDFSYEFTTDHGIKYRAYFMEGGLECPGFPFLDYFVYTFNLKVLSGDILQSGHDPRIADTIFKVIANFLMGVEHRAFYYVCDSSDSRELARKRKFDQWFRKYNRVLFAKCDYIAVFKDHQIHNSMVVRTDSRHWELYLVMFDKLNRGDKIEECAA